MILKKLYFPKSNKIPKQVSIQFTFRFLNLAKKKCLIATLYKRKSINNFNFLGKIRLNFYYNKMTKKMYSKLLEKHKNSVFQILKIGKAIQPFTILILIRQFGKKYTWLCNYLEIKSQKGSLSLVILIIQIIPTTYLFSIQHLILRK